MAPSPIPVLLVAIISSAFVALVGGTELVEQSYPDFGDGTNFGGLDIIGDILEAIFGTVTYVFNLLTFNIDDAPWYIRLPIGVGIGGSLVWSVATLIRGN